MLRPWLGDRASDLVEDNYKYLEEIRSYKLIILGKARAKNIWTIPNLF